MKAASSLVLRFSENPDLWRYIQAYIHPFPLLQIPPAPGLTRPWTLSGEENGWLNLGGGPTESGQGVLDQGVSVNPSPGN